MFTFKCCVIAIGVALASSFALGANTLSPRSSSTFPIAAEARATQLNAKISPAAREWIQQEAKRESNNNDISEVVARKAITGAGSALDLSAMSVEDAILMIMMTISNDASNDMKQIIAGAKEKNTEKKALSDRADEKKSEVKVTANTKLRIGLTSEAPSSVGTNNAATVNQMALQKESSSSIDNPNEINQLKLQPFVDRREKANEVASKVIKKISNVSSAMAGNLK